MLKKTLKFLFQLLQNPLLHQILVNLKRKTERERMSLHRTVLSSHHPVPRGVFLYLNMSQVNRGHHHQDMAAIVKAKIKQVLHDRSRLKYSVCMTYTKGNHHQTIFTIPKALVGCTDLLLVKW
jgi:hypothetical protein